MADLAETIRLIPDYDTYVTAAPGDRFDEAAAARACDFFPECLKHIEGTFAGEPFVLGQWQVAIIANLFGWKRSDGTRRYREAFVAVPRGSGKALALDTPLPTPTGWATMGDVVVGDTLFNENGLPCSVLEVHPIQHGHKCYRVKFSDGSEIVADDEHLWTIADRMLNYRYVTLETGHIARTFNTGKRGYVEARYSIPVASPIQCDAAMLPIDPYVLGVWLGDGDSDCARITYSSNDSEIVEHICRSGVSLSEAMADSKSSAMRARLIRKDNDKCYRGHDPSERNGTHCRACERECDRARRRGLPIPPRTNLTIQEHLRSVGVLNNKHIPRAYLRASIQQRTYLLQGLMDADGSIDENRSRCEFCACNKRLAEDTMELVAGLGIKATIKASDSKLYGRVVGTRYRVSFTAFSDTPVFRLSRKLARQKPPPKTSPTDYRFIIGVDPVESVPVRCIRVDSPSRLFLAGRSMIPTHNTPLAAGICLYLLFCDNEPGAQIYSAGADVQQAGLLFRHAKGMIHREPELDKRATIHESYKSITLKSDEASVYRVVSSDAAGKHGYAPHGVLCDELHAWQGRELMDAFTSAFAKRGRRQPMLVHITTRDFERESICNEKWKYAENVRDGVVSDPAFLPVIYAAGDDDDWTAEDVWVKANPNIDVTVDRESLRRECAKAKATPAYENTFKRLHLNMKTQQDVRLFPIEQWDGCIVPGCSKSLSKQLCYGGLDLSTTEDITARVLVFPRNGKLVVLPHFWVPEETLRKRSQKDQVDYALWVRQGYMTATPGNVIDYDFVFAKLLEDRKQYDLKEIGYDPWNATQLAVKLEADRFKIEQVRQGFASLNEPTKRIITMLASGKIEMEANPVFRWMALNVAAETDAAGNLKPSKAKSTGRIDGIVAAVMAVSMWMQHAKGAGAYTGKGASIWL